MAEAEEEAPKFVPAEAIRVLPPVAAAAPAASSAPAPFAFDDAPAGVPGIPDLQARGPYASCPFCHNPGYADKVSFTWWGGLVGPAMFSHVKCRKCRRAYNGKTGKSNDTAIAIYIAVTLTISIFLLVCAALVSVRR
jgi:hypothetical protein